MPYIVSDAQRRPPFPFITAIFQPTIAFEPSPHRAGTCKTDSDANELGRSLVRRRLLCNGRYYRYHTT